jgi:hypothetical protein
MRDSRRAIKAAEDAAEASVGALAHARETAERDFRPWLTLNARLISPVAADPLQPSEPNQEKGFAFFIELRCCNVGKVAALNVVYGVSGIDLSFNEDRDIWLQKLISGAVHDCKFAGPQNWRPEHSLERSSDSLAPSEEYKAKRWCQIAPPKPESRWSALPKEARIHEFCVGIVAAYTGVGSDERIFYTAKVLPIGWIHLVEFLGLIADRELPLGVADVGIGPTYKAIAT